MWRKDCYAGQKVVEPLVTGEEVASQTETLEH